jgi:hypothetical protein
MSRVPIIALAGLFIGVFGQSAAAATIWDEGTNGDLSGNTAAPTSVTVAIGTNTVIGSTVGSEGGPDRDIFTFTVPDGAVLAEIVLTSFSSEDDLAFLGLQAGSSITDTSSADELLGWLHPSAAFVGTDILDDIAQGAGAIGFTEPLGPGTYTLWMQQGDPELVSYSFDLIIEPAAVPEPPLATLLALGLFALVVGRRRGALFG